jgi:2-polyprenyl-3-methyl-5-hydroxy-6-metoxy-1,4-benzoquinol methylase
VKDEMTSYIDQINDFIEQISSKRNKIFVLEAGCGSRSTFDFGIKAFVTGVDISLEQLRSNKRLDNKILGDIVTDIFQPLSFDVIVCRDVLEHLRRPD